MGSAVDEHEVEKLISNFTEASENPELFIEPQTEKCEKFKSLLKRIYELTVASNKITGLKTRSLPKLLTDGFDLEQIWQQVEIQNKAAFPHYSGLVSAIRPQEVTFSLRRENGDQNLNHKSAFDNKLDNDDDDDKYGDEFAFDDDSDSDSELIRLVQKRAGETNADSDNEELALDDEGDSSVDLESGKQRENAGDSDDDDELAYDDLDKIEAPVPNQRKITYKSKVDDQFFKLSELEEFLKLEDLKEENKLNDTLNDEEDDIDMFQDVPSDDLGDDESSDETNEKTAKDIMYEDFFDAPLSGDEKVNQDSDSPSKPSRKSQQFSDDKANLEDELDEDCEGLPNSSKHDELKNMDVSNDVSLKTAFDIEQEKIKRKIQECEEKMLEPMSWQLTGEVAASSRPVNSLVDQEFDFDSNAKQEIIIDNDLTERIENIIRMAIINKAFCDVERKVKPTEEVIAYKKEVALEQVKSKKSLAEVYEEDYLKKQSKNEEEEENPKHKEIKKLMDSLLPELHALFSHIPKPAIPEIKVVSNLPAVTVEEVAPTGVSDATLLAPEEVKKKSGLVKGKTERTDTDRKRERRKKKIHQRLKEKKRQEKLAQADPKAKLTKLQKLDMVKKLKQNRNTKLANVDDGAKIKSSKDFFSRLQDKVDSKVSKKNSGKRK